MDKPLLTVKEVAVLIGESVHIIRNWLKDLKDYIPLEKNEAGYNLFNEKAVEMIQTIKRLHRDNGYSMKQIEHYFATGGREFIPVTSPEAEEVLAKELQDVKEALKAMSIQLQKQEEFNKALTMKLDQQQAYIERVLKERDELLLKSMSEIEKKTTNLQLMASEERERRPWWKFWQ